MLQFLALIAVAATTSALPAVHRANATIRSDADTLYPAPGTSERYLTVFNALHSMAPDGQRVANVAQVDIPLDGGLLRLASGQVSMLSLEGSKIGFAFAGDATFSFNPPTQVERDQVERFFDAPTPDIAVGRLVLIHESPGIESVLNTLDFGPATPVDEARKIVEQAVEYLGDEDSGTFDSGVMSALLNGVDGSFVHLHMDPDDEDPIFYRFDSSKREEVSMGRRAQVKGPRRFETISRFHATAEVEPIPGERDFQLLDIVNFDVDVVLDKGLDFSARADMYVVPNRSGESWAPFSLYSKLKVDSVSWDGVPASFHQGDESPQFWVRIPEGAQEGAPAKLSVHYEGDLIDKSRIGWYFINSPTGWYPRIGDIDAMFNLKFQTPKDLQFTAAGQQVGRRQEGDQVHWEYQVDRPAPHATFNIGKFEEYTIDREGIPNITLQVNEQAHRRLEQYLLQENIGDMVGGDIANALSFFGQKFGELPVEEFYVTEIPYGHGQAFPGMIELSWVTFQWTGKDGDDEIFRAHEVAHQWWGLGVEPATYHDTWLSEGLSEFSGLWYMQRVLMNNKNYFDHLEDSRKKILKRRGKSGPVSLGPRLYTSDTESDYQTVVYEKGAWVMHMLRNIMIDIETMNEDAFFGMLRDVYQTYQNRTVSTDQFRAAVEARVGTDMTWFFDQWVYGTDIPTYEFSHRGVQTPEGWTETVRVEQSDVPDDFMMVVPILLDFGDEGSVIVRSLITGPVSEFELPLLPRKPDNIEFNTLQSVLAEVDEVDWR